MPYIVVKSDGKEIARRELFDGLTVGRAQDCDLVIRDIALSRKHARFHGGPGGWRVIDLQSKNGTIVNTTLISCRSDLADNDIVRIGRNKILFFSDVPEGFIDDGPPPSRPADPSDSLSGTLSGFTLLLPGETDSIPDRPCPLPSPKEPAAYENEDLRQLLTAIASSSWDSIYAQARQPLRATSAATAESVETPRRIHRPRNPVDWSLQADHQPPPQKSREPSARRFRRAMIGPKRNLRQVRRRVRPQLPLFAATVWLTAACIFVCNVVHSGPSPIGPARAGAATINRPAVEPSQPIANPPAPMVHAPARSAPRQPSLESIVRALMRMLGNSDAAVKGTS